MTVSSEMVSLIILLFILILVVGIFIRITIRIRRGGGSLTTISLGATDAFLTKDRQKAAETIVNRNAGKRLDEQSSAEPMKAEQQGLK
jgi:hypothetical protein